MPRDPVSEIVLIKERAGKYKRVPSYYDIDHLRSSWEVSESGQRGRGGRFRRTLQRNAERLGQRPERNAAIGGC